MSSQQDRREQWAVFWCSLLAPLLYGEIPAEEAGPFLRQLTETECEFPDGTRRKPARATLWRKWKKYRDGGFEALFPKRRCDRGKPRHANREIRLADPDLENLHAELRDLGEHAILPNHLMPAVSQLYDQASQALRAAKDLHADAMYWLWSYAQQDDGDDIRALSLPTNLKVLLVAVAELKMLNCQYTTGLGPTESQRPTDSDQEVSTPQEPKTYLWGWPEIAAALDQKHDEAFQKRIKQMHDRIPSPILFGGRGTPPKVGKAELIQWWNVLLDRLRELDERKRNEAASVRGRHPYGRDETVIPEIKGHEKQRRTKQN